MCGLAWQAKTKRALWYLAIAAAVLLLCSKSSPLFAFNDWMDANIFFTMGKSMFSGKVLYRDVFDHKGPVLYLLYGLGSLADRTGFTGVFALEVLSFALFLALGVRTAAVLCGRALHPAWAALPAAAVAAGRAFFHGGSAEEFLLPFLAAALYGGLRALCAGRRMPLPAVALQGFLAGCALWLKYTVLGFYLAWAALLALWYVRRGWGRALAQSCGAYLGGMALATLPWAVYFGVHGALGDWFTAYFYDNLFLYTGAAAARPPGAASVVGGARRAAGRGAVCPFSGLGVCGAPPRGGGLGRRAGGRPGADQPAGRVSCVLQPGAGRLCAAGPGAAGGVAARRPLPRWLRCAAPWAALAAAALFCWAASPNRNLRGRAADTLPQIRFAAQINAQPGASLLNYGTLDGGFYTAAGVLPPCRYFCVTNMPLEAQWAEQNTLLQTGAVDYAVALVDDLQTRFPRYVCIDACRYDGGEGEVTWYLYQKQG